MSERKRITIDGKRMRNARYIMEQHLDRKLTDEEVVHHINGDVADDRIENLQLMRHGEHTTLHHWKGGQAGYYQRNRERILEQLKKWYQNNKEKKQKYNKEYRQKNKERLRIKDKEYYQKNKERILKTNKAYRKRKKEETQ